MPRRLIGGLVIAVAVAACGGPSPTAAGAGVTLSPSASPFQSSTVGAYRLDLRLDGLVWKAGAPMTGTATLTHLVRSQANLVGAGSGLIVFDYAEVGGGQRTLMAPSTADCAPHVLAPGTTLTAPLGKGGSYDPANPSDSWIAHLLNASGVQLPAGTWDVTAVATFQETDCGGPSYAMSATVRVAVSP